MGEEEEKAETLEDYGIKDDAKEIIKEEEKTETLDDYGIKEEKTETLDDYGIKDDTKTISKEEEKTETLDDYGIKDDTKKENDPQFEDIAGYYIEENAERIILHPKTEHNSTLIWLHGFGHKVRRDGVKVFTDSDHMLPNDCKIILPKAKEDGSWYPVNGEHMDYWFDCNDPSNCHEPDEIKELYKKPLNEAYI